MADRIRGRVHDKVDRDIRGKGGGDGDGSLMSELICKMIMNGWIVINYLHYCCC